MVYLTGLVNGSNHTKSVSLSNQKCMIQMNAVKNFTTINFWLKLDRCAGSCNTINDLSNKACVPNKTEDLILSVFNMITGIN